MANIYDIARISAGDPQQQVRESAKEASAQLEQYKHQKEIIEQMNAAIADAERKSKKGKFGSSVLGGLLGMGATGLLAGPLGLGASIAGGLGAGAGAGIAEKLRQKKYAPTKKLKELEGKLKGRKQYKDVAQTRKGFQKGLDQMVLSDMMSSALLGAITPGVKMKEGQQAITDIKPQMGTNVGGAGSIDPSALKETLTSMDSTSMMTPKLDVGYPASDFIREDIPGIPGVASTPDTITTIFGETPIKDGSGKLAQKNSKDLVQQMFGFEMGDEAMQMLNKPWMSNLLRSLGPAAYGEFTGLTPYADPYAMPQFRNPYGSMGGY